MKKGTLLLSHAVYFLVDFFISNFLLQPLCLISRVYFQLQQQYHGVDDDSSNTMVWMTTAAIPWCPQ
jgi:hypothetical protein